MANPPPDLAQFVQRRELMAYEQRLARMSYAYGVDLRRSAWLGQSTLGEPLMRGVDRRWNELTTALQAEVVQPPDAPVPTLLLEEIARLVRLLRAPLPSLRLLRNDASREQWPTVVPLATTSGAVHWLILDLLRLQNMSPTERTFVLAAAIGHLQCDHGPIFAAHLMAHRIGRAFAWVRTLMRPWSRVAYFSADRAALLGVAALDPTLEALRRYHDHGVPWYPTPPDLALREQALIEFDKSRVMTRLRMLYAHPEQWQVGSEQPANPEASEAGNDSPPETPPEPSPEEAARQAELEAAMRSSWPLSRCDERLTRRLGLL